MTSTELSLLSYSKMKPAAFALILLLCCNGHGPWSLGRKLLLLLTLFTHTRTGSRFRTVSAMTRTSPSYWCLCTAFPILSAVSPSTLNPGGSRGAETSRASTTPVTRPSPTVGPFTRNLASETT